MSTGAYNLLRFGLGLTFVWIGILIWRQPTVWGGLLSPWALDLLPASLEQTMMVTAILDMAIGAALIAGFWPAPVSLLAAFHLVLILATAGINSITVRDIGLLAAALAIFWDNRKNFWAFRAFEKTGSSGFA